MIRLIFITLVGLCSINGLPQNQQAPSNASAQGINMRGSFATIVTPEPVVDPTSEPIQMVVDGERCVCVPYYLCNADTNTIQTDGSIDGFGQIDIRWNPEGCKETLAVCCKPQPTDTVPVSQPDPTPAPLPVPNPNGPQTIPTPPTTVATLEPIVVPTTAMPPAPVQPTGCGIRHVNGIDFELIGATNNEAGFAEFPWTVALIYIPNDACLCGGSLIHPSVILTAGHCVDKVKSSDLKIRAGEWDTQTTKERLSHQERLADRIVIHEDFNSKNLQNDPALVHVEYDFQLDLHISTVCLPPQGEIPQSRNCYATGWGKDEFGKRGKYSVIMKRVKLPIVDRQTCEEELQETRLTHAFRLHESFICAGGEEGVDTCQGDGGAPLVCPTGKKTDNKYVQVGIVAWGIGCKQNHPAVYCHVAHFRNWIDSQMRILGLDISSYLV